MKKARYGTVSINDPYTPNEFDLEARNGRDRPNMCAFADDFNPKDAEFWKKVQDRYSEEKNKAQGLKWVECLDEIRADRIIERYDTFDPEEMEGTDPIVLMMTEWYDTLELGSYEPFGSGPERFSSYERQICKLAKIIIGRDYDKYGRKSRYAEPILDDNGIQKTLLHLAAEGFKQRENLHIVTRKRDFVEIARVLIERDPGLLYVTTHPGKRKKTPLELALENFDDEMASLLMNKMGKKSRIRLLFEYDNLFPDSLPPFKLKTYIERPDMGKTVVAVLDSLISPDWPNLPKKEQEKYEEEWHQVPDIPVRYQFYYNILDGDEHGRVPEHPDFNHRQLSCLQAICQSKHNKNAIQHPVIRKLADTKWSNYGALRITLYALLYLVFLIVLSLALLGAVHSSDPTKYETTKDKVRAFCEMITLVFAAFYMIIELDQMEKEGCAYFRDVFNYADLAGLLSLVAVIPFRYENSNVQWYLATISYVLNCLRIFKYFPANKSLGLYAKILYGLFVHELWIFAAVYVVILFTFSGGTYLSLKATTPYNSLTGFTAVGVTGFSDIMLRGFRAVAEANGFADGYASFHAFAILIILIGLLVIMLFLINILIAQLTTTYERSKDNARLEYDISKALFVTRLENSRFRTWNLRMKHFQEGEFVNDKEEIIELLKGWDTLHPESKDSTTPRVFK